MVVEERARRELQEALMGTIGSDNTDTLMGYLPPTGWADVATKRDLDTLRTALRGEIAGLRAEVGGVRAEIGGLRGEFHAQLHQHTQTLFYRLLMVQLAVLAMVVALVTTGVLA